MSSVYDTYVNAMAQIRQPAQGSALAALQHPPLPIVFADVTDPVRQGFVKRWRGPAGSITRFAMFEFSMGGKMALTCLTNCTVHEARCGSIQSANSGLCCALHDHAARGFARTPAAMRRQGSRLSEDCCVPRFRGCHQRQTLHLSTALQARTAGIGTVAFHSQVPAASVRPTP
jgi:hypothetical protein